MRAAPHIYQHPMCPSLQMDTNERKPVLIFHSFGNVTYEAISRTRAAMLLKWWRAAR